MVGLIKKINCLKCRQRTIITRNFANYSQDDYCVNMNSAPWMQVFSQNNVKDAWQHMKTIMLNIMNNHAPLVQRRIKGSSNIASYEFGRWHNN